MDEKTGKDKFDGITLNGVPLSDVLDKEVDSDVVSELKNEVKRISGCLDRRIKERVPPTYDTSPSEPRIISLDPDLRKLNELPPKNTRLEAVIGTIRRLKTFTTKQLCDEITQYSISSVAMTTMLSRIYRSVGKGNHNPALLLRCRKSSNTRLYTYSITQYFEMLTNPAIVYMCSAAYRKRRMVEKDRCRVGVQKTKSNVQIDLDRVVQVIKGVRPGSVVICKPDGTFIVVAS